MRRWRWRFGPAEWQRWKITPDGTRFIAFGDSTKIGVTLAPGFVLGAVVVALTGTRRIKVVRRME